MASAIHGGQKRDAGQPYITHPIAVALILAWELGFADDPEMMAAALLHDAVEDGPLSLDDLRPIFGPAITDLVHAVTKVESSDIRSRNARRAATLQRLFSAAHDDPRVLILKLADRVHNMRSIDGIRERRRRNRIAQETVDVYAPVSYLLGMDRIRRELEDRSLGCLEPRVHRQLSRLMEDGPPQPFLDFEKALSDLMNRNGIRMRIRLHAKSLSSVHRKMKASERTNGRLVNIYDQYAVKVIVSNRDACYRALGVLHSQCPPIMARIRDFVGLPKRNGYRALHTTVMHAGMRFEVHIQTPSMYRMAELGVAALRSDQRQEEQRQRWLLELSEWHEQPSSSVDFLDEVKRILFTQEIAVFTPKGDPIVLPEEATLVDFAFAVHSDLGLRCSGGTVNGRRATPFSALRWGDTAEVKTSETQAPKQAWLHRVKTFRARRIIRRYLLRPESYDGRKPQ
jgi:GTP diphosphokinase / guanosine-3',5'-bis(diphosphate) 3'-diphosphatase